MDCQAHVLALHAHRMDISVQPATACRACGARRSCQGGTEGRVFSLPLAPGLAVGSTVTLRLPDGRLALGALLAYLLPVLSLLAGAVLGEPLGGNAGALAGCGTGLLLGLAAARGILRRRGEAWFAPQLLPSPAEQTPAAPLPPSITSTDRSTA